MAHEREVRIFGTQNHSAWNPEIHGSSYSSWYCSLSHGLVPVVALSIA